MAAASCPGSGQEVDSVQLVELKAMTLHALCPEVVSTPLPPHRLSVGHMTRSLCDPRAGLRCLCPGAAQACWPRPLPRTQMDLPTGLLSKSYSPKLKNPQLLDSQPQLAVQAGLPLLVSQHAPGCPSWLFTVPALHPVPTFAHWIPPRQ